MGLYIFSCCYTTCTFSNLLVPNVEWPLKVFVMRFRAICGTCATCRCTVTSVSLFLVACCQLRGSETHCDVSEP